MKEKLCIFFIDISGLLGIIFQFTNIPPFFKFIVTIIFICALLYYLYIFISKCRTYSREKRIKKVSEFIMNSKNKIVFFGGNLSWTNDYIRCIREKILEGNSVDIYYDNNSNMSTDAIEDLNNCIELLRKNGCNVYKLDDCYSLRCIISDAFNESNDTTAIIIKKAKRSIDITKNRYKISYFNFNDNNLLATLLFDIVKIVQKISDNN